MGNRVKGNLKRKFVSALVLSLVLSSCPSFLSFADSVKVQPGDVLFSDDFKSGFDPDDYPDDNNEMAGNECFINYGGQTDLVTGGFTIHDDILDIATISNSLNKLKIYNGYYGVSSIYTGISSVGRISEIMALEFNESSSPGTHTYIEFTPECDSDIVVRTGSFNHGDARYANKKIYLKEDGNDNDDGLQVLDANPSGIGVESNSANSVVVFNAKANKTYHLYADGGMRPQHGTLIYYLKVFESLEYDSWDFTDSDSLGDIVGEYGSISTAYYDGLFMEACSYGLWTTEDQGVCLSDGSNIYVPIHSGKILTVSSDDSYADLTINGNVLTSAEYAFNTNDYTGTDRAGYVKISAGGNVCIKNIQWKTPVAVPTAATNLTYNGQSQTGVTAGTGYTLTGNTATEAGTYTATAKLSEGYIWSDGTVADKTIRWSIAQSESQSGGQSQTTDTQNKVSKITLSKTKVSVKVGASANVTATLKNDTIKSVKSAKTSIAKVSFKGKKITIKGVKAGSTKITVKTKSGLTKTIKVTVTPTTTKLTVSKTSVTLQKKGKKVTVKATATPNKSKTGESITVSSSNKKVATVSINQKTGKITIKAVKKGSCKITVKAGNIKKTIKVKVKK